MNPFNPTDPFLDDAIKSCYSDLMDHKADTEEHQKIVDQLTNLYALQQKRVDPNVVLTVLGNLAIGLTVLKYEQTGVITTKVMQFLGKMG